MLENDQNSVPSQNDEPGSSTADYRHRAARAIADGSPVLAMHLYLAAFERGRGAEGTAPDEAAIDALKRAWRLACSLKERSIAEYVFERLEPYISSEETAACAEQLQNLALDKLEEYGLSREDLEDMTDMISQDFLGVGGARLMRVEHVELPAPRAQAKRAGADEPVATATAEGAGAQAGDSATKAPAAASPASSPAAAAQAQPGASPASASAGDGANGGSDASSRPVVSSLESLTYKDLVGYDAAVATMRTFGVGMQKDPGFQQLVSQLNARHGLDRMPATDSLLFSSPAREDANRFMVATLGELGLPAVRMRMEENLQGMPVLCVMAQADRQPKLNALKNAFDGPGVLLLEDLDTWISPLSEGPDDDLGGLIYASLSRGAREAVNLISSAAADPDVYVLASAASGTAIDPFFLDLLDPLSEVSIDYPTERERADLWMAIAHDHPSVRGVDRGALVRYSAHMPRYDIYMAAREAVEEAYKESLVARRYVPVTQDNLFDKLAAYQPLDSQEYRALEEACVSDFRRALDGLDSWLDEGAK